MSYAQEFESVDLIVGSNAETRGVDAFVLSLIKCERQVRRLLTYVVFQYPCFVAADIPKLRCVLERNKGVYFDGLIQGFDALSPRSIQELVGQEYGRLRPRLIEATGHRNKIFHGQLTSSGLNREELLAYVSEIRCWCKALSHAALAEIGYDGFARDSFRKYDEIRLWERCKFQLTDIASYESFIKQHMQR